MPGSGKSFIGKQLAESLDFSFIDPDKILEQSHGKPLQQVLETLGEEMFLHAEEELSVASLEKVDRTVLATGGSIVYSHEAMETLSRLSSIIYLKVDLETLQHRTGNIPRGVIGLKNKSYKQLFEERSLLYEKWAAITINGSQSPNLVIGDMLKALYPKTTSV